MTNEPGADRADTPTTQGIVGGRLEATLARLEEGDRAVRGILERSECRGLLPLATIADARSALERGDVYRADILERELADMASALEVFARQCLARRPA